MTPSYAELRVSFSNPCLAILPDNTEQLTASCQLTLALDNKTVARGKPFSFLAPIGAEETAEIRWYLESYYIWPVGQFQQRAQEAERSFSLWGEQLLAALLVNKPETSAFKQWLDSTASYERTFSLHVEPGNTPNSALAASRLLELPWELLHQNNHYLFTNTLPISIKRHISGLSASPPDLPDHLYDQQATRILIVSPRPLQADYIDHRSSVKPLVETLAKLDKQTELVKVNPPTFNQLETELDKARTEGKPFHILHFDGHGEFNLDSGRGMLCFEHPLELKGEFQRPKQNIDTRRLEQLLTANPVPLVFLEACQTAKSEVDPSTSVATAMLQAGALSVVAMSHNVLVETTRRFVNVFYRQLVAGKRVSTAITAGRGALIQDTNRISVAGAGTLQMQDWFVPVLYQHETETNPNLFIGGLPNTTKELTSLLLGDLPKTLTHTEQFIGRSRDLLKAERLLDKQKYIVIRGMGGIGKTALAIELAYWLVQCKQFKRCAFVSVETYTHNRAILDTLGKQLVDERYTVAEYGDNLEQALQPITQVLQQEHCLLVLDNLESLLADVGNIESVLALFERLLSVDPTSGTRLLFTTREPLPAPFADKHNEIELREMELADAKALVMQVMHYAGLELKANDQGNSLEEVDALVNGVGRHPRALVLLARELATDGVKATTKNIHRIMEKLDRKYPGDRENSLFASIELSLKRLSPETQRKIEGLAVFQGGGHWLCMGDVLDIDEEEMSNLVDELIETGLAHLIGQDGHLFLGYLPLYLARYINQESFNNYLIRFFHSIWQLVDFLYNQQFQDMALSASLTKLELANLLLFTKQSQDIFEHDNQDLEKLERLLHSLDSPIALQEVVSWRKNTNQAVAIWSHQAFQSERLHVEHCLHKKMWHEALKSAEQLLKKCEDAGHRAYKEAYQDSCYANFYVGSALSSLGRMESAIDYLNTAYDGFVKLKSRMAIVALSEKGDCYKYLGQLDLAERFYKQSIKHYNKNAEQQGVAGCKVRLASVLMRQKKFKKAIKELHDSLAFYTHSNDIKNTAMVNHQLGIVYREMEDFTTAEKFYLKALASESKLAQISSDQANITNELGSLYGLQGGLDKAIVFFNQAIHIANQLDDLWQENLIRANLANALYHNNDIDNSRSVFLLVIENSQQFGHAAEVWKSWAALYHLEIKAGNSHEAQHAKQQAEISFYSYRKSGGENYTVAGKLCESVLSGITSKDLKKARSLLKRSLRIIEWAEHHYFLSCLQEILNGERSLSVFDADKLDFDQIVEIQILLEALSRSPTIHS